jgi:hypothetical protein
MNISYRMTRKGDWMVCEAISATYGTGVYKTGSPAPGYNTGVTFGRYPNESIAQAEAARIAAERGGTVVQWEYPAQNPQFVDLPKKYPQQTEYASFAEADEDGWIHANPSKTLHVHRGKRVYVRDFTPGASFGYEMVICVEGATETLAKSESIWADGKFSVRFRSGDIVDAIERAIGLIDWMPIL